MVHSLLLALKTLSSHLHDITHSIASAKWHPTHSSSPLHSAAHYSNTPIFAAAFTRQYSTSLAPHLHNLASNTSLVKTLVSAGLSMSFLSSSSSPAFPKRRFVYLKPIQTGFPDDSDSSFVYRKFCQFYASKSLPLSVFASNSVLRASMPAANEVLGNGFLAEGGEFGCGLKNLQWHEERKLQGTESNGVEQFPVSEAVCKTLYAWKEAVSPHLAAEREEAMVSDSEVLDLLRRCLENDTVGNSGSTEEVEVMSVTETAGGVASPGPSGSLQCDLYRCVFILSAYY